PPHAAELPEQAHVVCSQVPGSVWRVLVHEGDAVAEGDTLAIVESMKMEFAVTAPCAGYAWRVACREGAPVSAGQEVVIVVPQSVAAKEAA
ncbi:acyl-CoA carboxylase biotin carboxyl carrier protein subunit, partial [Cupriavidus sp. 8B]